MPDENAQQIGDETTSTTAVTEPENIDPEEDEGDEYEDGDFGDED